MCGLYKRQSSRLCDIYFIFLRAWHFHGTFICKHLHFAFCPWSPRVRLASRTKQLQTYYCQVRVKAYFARLEVSVLRNDGQRNCVNKGNVHCFHAVMVGLAAKEQTVCVIRRMLRAFHCRACFLPEWGIVSFGLRDRGYCHWVLRGGHRVTSGRMGKPLVCWGDDIKVKGMTGTFIALNVKHLLFTTVWSPMRGRWSLKHVRSFIVILIKLRALVVIVVNWIIMHWMENVNFCLLFFVFCLFLLLYPCLSVFRFLWVYSLSIWVLLSCYCGHLASTYLRDFWVYLSWLHESEGMLS
jgi:hypothetical protein